MKKLVALLCAFAAVMAVILPSYAGAPDIKLFFNGNTYQIQNILSHYDEYFLYAEELAAELGAQYSVSFPDSSLRLEYEGATFASDFKVFNGWGEVPEKYAYDTLLIVNGRLLVPFSYMRKSLGMAVEYYRDSGIIYILPTAQSGAPALTRFTNLTYDYSLLLSDGVYLRIPDPESGFHDATVSLADKYNLFSAEIKCDRLDDDTIKAMRVYLSDSSLSDDDLFRRFIGYWRDYFNIKQDYYKKGYIYGKQDDLQGETNIHIFKEYDDVLFGQDSHILLYNTLVADRQAPHEETHIDISIPVVSNRTIYSVNFTLNKNDVNEMTFDRMSRLLNSLEIGALPSQAAYAKIFTDQDSINASNYGIYGESQKIQQAYVEYINRPAGYKTALPSSYTPYIQNSIVDTFDYKSFKIDFNATVSISAEPAFFGAASIQEKIKQIQFGSNGKAEIKNINQLSLPGKDVSFIQYEVRQSGGDPLYVHSYLINKNSKLYCIELSNRYGEPSQLIQNEIRRMVLVLDFIPPASTAKTEKEDLISFTNITKKYSFLYPKSWKLAQNTVDKYGYVTLSFVNPDLTSSVDIFVNEGELYGNFDYSQIAHFLTPLDPERQSDFFFWHYDTPYAGKRSKTLLFNCQFKADQTYYIYKLVNYLDTDDKSRLCYTLDIIKGRSVYSFYIAVGEYATVDGRFFDGEVSRLISRIAESFRLD